MGVTLPVFTPSTETLAPVGKEVTCNVPPPRSFLACSEADIAATATTVNIAAFNARMARSKGE